MMTGTTYRVTCNACADYVEFGSDDAIATSRRMSAGWEMGHSHDGASFSRRWITTPADESRRPVSPFASTPEPSPVEEQTSVLREIRDLLSVSTRKASER